MHIHTYIYTYIYIYIYVHIHIHAYTYTHVHSPMCTQTDIFYMNIDMYNQFMHMFIFTHAWVYLYTLMHAQTQPCTHIVLLYWVHDIIYSPLCLLGPPSKEKQLQCSEPNIWNFRPNKRLIPAKFYFIYLIEKNRKIKKEI